MENEMIERVAHAIWRERQGELASDKDLARAAIEAMREPTETMRLAGYNVLCDPDHDYVPPAEHHWEGYITPHVFRAMIDAALPEALESGLPAVTIYTVPVEMFPSTHRE